MNQIVFNFDDIHPILKQNFIDKFQYWLLVCDAPFISTYSEPHIDDRSLGFHSEFLSLCPNIEQINLIFYHKFNEKFDLTSNRFKKFKFNSTGEQSVIQSIIVYNKDSLKCIEFMVRDQDRGQAIRLLPTLSRVKNLERLAILFRAYYEDEFEFIRGTEQVQFVHMDQYNDPIENFLTDTISGLIDIGLLCCRLKHLKLKIHLFKSSECSQVFETMGVFTRLTRLDLSLFADVTDSLYSYYCGWLKGCHNLTHVTLNHQIDGLSPEIYSFGDMFFNRIDENLPKLQNLCISYPILTVEGLTSLSKLTQLQKLMINTNKFWEPGCFYKTYDIIKNNPKLMAFKMTQPVDLNINLVFDLEQYFNDVRRE